MFGWIRKLFTTSPQPAAQPAAKFDHAQTNDQNYRHWQNADRLGPISSLDPAVRGTLRSRCRYERDNDPNLSGLNRKMPKDLIGTGPRLQLQVPPEVPAEDVRKVEKLFAKWSRKSRFGLHLRVMAAERRVAGEVYATLETDESIRHPVKLKLNPFESDLITEPHGMLPPGNWEDGIDYDEQGNPRRYAIQISHPGDGWGGRSNYKIVEAAHVMHWFTPDRPGQIRGVTDFAPSLGTVAQHRRYGNATLSSAEFAASVSGVMYTDGDLEEGPATVKPMEKFQLEQNMALTMPAGWNVKQLAAEQPTSSYKEFSASKLCEVGRPVGAPFNVMTGNSSGYNYSSGRLDHVPYHRDAWIERDDLECVVIDHVIEGWLREAKVLGLIPASLGPVDELEWICQWDGFNSIDPFKDAQASEKRLQVGLTTLSEECAAEGRNWRDVLEQQAVEMKLRRELGLPDPTAPSTGPPAPGATHDDDDQLDDDDDTELDRPVKPAKKKGAERVPV